MLQKLGLHGKYQQRQKKRKLEGTGINPTDTESKYENSMSPQEGIDNLRRLNSLLDPALAVADLDTFNPNPDIFEDEEMQITPSILGIFT